MPHEGGDASCPREWQLLLLDSVMTKEDQACPGEGRLITWSLIGPSDSLHRCNLVRELTRFIGGLRRIQHL